MNCISSIRKRRKEYAHRYRSLAVMYSICVFAFPSLRPIDTFTVLEPHDQEINVFYVVRQRLTTDFEAPKL